MAKYKTIKDNVNLYDTDKGITKTLPIGTVVDIKKSEYSQLYDQTIVYGYISDTEYIITSFKGMDTVEKVQIKKKKEVKKDA